MSGGREIVVFGLSLASSWGNGHATTYRALLRGLHRLGHRVTFLEREVPWYAGPHRDLPAPEFCDLGFYADPNEIEPRFGPLLRRADAVIVGSYVPDGPTVIDRVLAMARGSTAFYDIDTPVTLAALVAGRCDYLDPRQIPAFDLYLSFTGGPTLRRLEAEFGARRATALYCAVEETAYRPTGEAVTWDLGYLGTYSADRQPTLERLLLNVARRLPERSFVVAGPQYPGTIDWPANVERIDHLPPGEHPSFYARQRWTLNVTRADMIAAGWSPSVRLFEAAACGTPIVSDRWPGLSELFPDGEALMTAGNTEEVVALLTGEEEARLRIAARARELVLEGHTGTVRAGDLLRALEGARPPRIRRNGPVREAVG